MQQKTYRPLEESWWFCVVWVLAQVFMALMLIALILALLNLIFGRPWSPHATGHWSAYQRMLGLGFIAVCGLMSLLWKLHGDKRERQNPSIKSAYLILLLLVIVAYQAIDASLGNKRLIELQIFHAQTGPIVDAATGQPLSDVHFQIDGSDDMPLQIDAIDDGYRLTWVDFRRYSWTTVSSPGYESKTIVLSDDSPRTITLKSTAAPPAEQ